MTSQRGGFPWLPPHAADLDPQISGVFLDLIFYADFGLRDVSQRRDLEILPRMGSGRARDDFKSPDQAPGQLRF